jgi:hypothetical protein
MPTDSSLTTIFSASSMCALPACTRSFCFELMEEMWPPGGPQPQVTLETNEDAS